MATSAIPVRTASARALTYAAYISFVPIGIATVLLGPMLPNLAERWSLNYSQSGALFAVQYLFSTCGVAFSGALTSRWGFRFPIKSGLILMAVGLALLLSGSRVIGVLSVGAYGLGLGLAVPAANLLVAAANPGRRSSTLNLLNFFWSTGAVACPFLVAAAAKTQTINLFLLSVTAFSLAIATGIGVMPRQIEEPPAIRDAEPALPLIRRRVRIFLILATLFFLYVGVENSFGEWMASYVKSLGSLTLATALATPAFFYASLMLGRWIAPLLLHSISDIKLVQAGSLLACAGMAGLMFSRGLPGIAISAMAAGLGLSSLYPIAISLLSQEFESASIGSVMFTLSNIGGGLLPWIAGIASERAGTLKTGLLVPLSGCITMFVLYLRNWKRPG